MAARLRELGFEVDPAPIDARQAGGKPVGRPHLAAAVLAHPANAAPRRRGPRRRSSFIPAYLIQGTPGYVARTHPTVEEAIRWIHDAAGVAVWAHPFWDIKDERAVLAAIERYVAAGLDGVEVFYVSHSAEQTELLADRCAELGCWPRARRTTTARAPALQPLPRLRSARPRAEPGADRRDPSAADSLTRAGRAPACG